MSNINLPNTDSSILDRDNPRPIVIDGDSTPSWIIIVISLVIIILFWIWIIYTIRTNPSSGDPIMECAPGQCVTDVATGIKDCPTDVADIKTINPVTQVCNSPFTCENDRTPYALRSDGSTDLDGVCETGVQCRCLTQPQCAYYVTSYFRAQNGNPFQSIQPQRLVFEQTSSGLNANDNFVSQPPYALSSPTTEFCAIPNEWLCRTWGSVLNPNSDLSTPINESLGPCLSGTMAYVPDNPNRFDGDQLAVTPLSCVQGTPCSSGLTPVWNNFTYQLDCVEITPPAGFNLNDCRCQVDPNNPACINNS